MNRFTRLNSYARVDVLIAFTNGVTEALNLGEEEFGNSGKDLLRMSTRSGQT
ncbi:MAG: serine/threonine-protein phosphatase [Acidobacteriota bacterium]|nr:serine/threonine-protein phosphatase [Acidobacteriota bacterium]